MMIAVSAIRKFLVRQREEAETTHKFLVVATKILRLNLEKKMKTIPSSVMATFANNPVF
jgi:hypothetical protein